MERCKFNFADLPMIIDWIKHLSKPRSQKITDSDSEKLQIILTRALLHVNRSVCINFFVEKRTKRSYQETKGTIHAGLASIADGLGHLHRMSMSRNADATDLKSSRQTLLQAVEVVAETRKCLEPQRLPSALLTPASHASELNKLSRDLERDCTNLLKSLPSIHHVNGGAHTAQSFNRSLSSGSSGTGNSRISSATTFTNNSYANGSTGKDDDSSLHEATQPPVQHPPRLVRKTNFDTRNSNLQGNPVGAPEYSTSSRSSTSSGSSTLRQSFIQHGKQLGSGSRQEQSSAHVRAPAPLAFKPLLKPANTIR